ncbi:MAG: hypothetical protein KatS3mg095_0916 [Candidatus Parcubacteria bacterium]|nr:MAG: hypothetical protein KatS3mg095_0916 [Candidatus Parcubacteria bacterium]
MGKEVYRPDNLFTLKVNICGIDLELPSQQSNQKLFENNKLTQRGKEFSRYLFNKIIENLPPDSNIETTRIRINEVLEELKKYLDPKFIAYLKKSINARLETFKRIKYLEEIKVTNSPFKDILKILEEYYKKSESFIANFAIPVIIRVKKEIENFAREIINKQNDLEEKENFFNILVSYMEHLFRDLVIERYQNSNETGLKFSQVAKEIIEEVKNIVNNLDLDLLQEEYEEGISKIESGGIAEEQPNSRERKGFFDVIGERLRKKINAAILTSLTFLSAFLNLSGVSRGLPLTGYLTDPSISLEVPSPREIKKRLEAPITVRDLEIKKSDLLRLPKNKEGLLKLEPGNNFYTEDLIRYAEQLTKHIFNSQNYSLTIKPENIKKYIKTVRFLAGAKILYPQAVKFQIIDQRENFKIEPTDYYENINIEREITGDVIIIGGELESVIGAIKAAKKGYKVILLYEGNLGGLSSDNGGNMRFFDFVENASVTPEMKELFDRLGMTERDDKRWVIPANVSQKLINLLSNYPNITIIQTKTLNSLLIEKEGKKIKFIITEEGIKISGDKFIDSSPEGIIAEKAGVPFTVETVNISYGVVFDVKNLNAEDLERLEKITKEDVLKILNMSEEEIMSLPELKDKYLSFLNALEKSKNDGRQAVNVGFFTRYGYSVLGRAIDLYLTYLTQTQRSFIHDINERRIETGFNIAINQENGYYTATFNSLSYRTEKSYHQGDHNLREDNDILFQVIREDLKNVEDFLRKLLGNEKLKLIIPKELYVRQATKNYSPLNLSIGEFLRIELDEHKKNI